MKKVPESQGLTAAGGIRMATRQLRYNQDPILRKRCKEVKEVDDRIRLLLDDMLDTLHHTENGAALAANQVGILKRLVVIDYYDKIENLETKLDGRFFKCHSSYLINLSYLKSYKNGMAYMINDQTIPVSRLRSKEFSSVVLKYMKERRV